MPDIMEQAIAHGFDLAKKGKKEEAYVVLKAVSDNLPDHPDNREALGVIRTRLVALCNDTGRQTESADYAEWVLRNAPPDDEMRRMMLQVALEMAGRDPSVGQEKKGGCFIATASYGSPFAAEVMVFREFRDKKLLPSKLGSAFVQAYYFVSPTVARVISKSEPSKAITRLIFLEPILRLIK